MSGSTTLHAGGVKTAGVARGAVSMFTIGRPVRQCPSGWGRCSLSLITIYRWGMLVLPSSH
eukprot:16451183-Heterocapsa_arctica.AAC.1